jgi:hypothetical protein
VADNSSRSVQEKSKKLLFDSLQKKTSYYLSKPALEDSDLYYYVKDFFREYLDIAHELSFDEIKREIDKIYIRHEVKESVNKFIDKVKVVEYKESLFDEEKIRGLINEFYGIVKSLREDEKKKRSSFNKFLKSLGLANSTEDDTIKVSTAMNADSSVKSVSEGVHNARSDHEAGSDDVKVSDGASDSGNFDVPDLDDDSTNTPIINNNPDLKVSESNNYPVENVDSKKEEVVDKNESISNKSKAPDFLSNVNLDDDFSKDVTLIKTSDGVDEWTEHVSGNDSKTSAGYENKDKSVSNNSNNKSVNSNVLDSSSKGKDDLPLFEGDIYSLIAQSKKVKNKNQLAQLYTEINDLYETKDVDEKEKIYPELISLFDRLSDDSKSSFDTEPPAFEDDDVYSLIETSKKTKNINQLTQLYKEINDLYETKGVEEKAKIYPELVSLYEKISKK